MSVQYRNVDVAYMSMSTNPACTEESRLLWRLSEGTFGEAEPEGRTSGCATVKAAVESVHFPLWRYNPAADGKKLTLDSADKSDTVSFAANAVSKELGENRADPCGRLRTPRSRPLCGACGGG